MPYCQSKKLAKEMIRIYRDTQTQLNCYSNIIPQAITGTLNFKRDTFWKGHIATRENENLLRPILPSCATVCILGVQASLRWEKQQGRCCINNMGQMSNNWKRKNKRKIVKLGPNKFKQYKKLPQYFWKRNGYRTLIGMNDTGTYVRYERKEVTVTVLASIPASSDILDSEGRQMKQCWIKYIKKEKSPCLYIQEMKCFGPHCRIQYL